MFWHRPANLSDSRTNLLPDLIVSLARWLLSLYAFSFDFCFCLSRAEEIGCELFTSHMIKYFFGRFEFLCSVDITSSSPAIESHISEIRKLPIVPDNSLFRGARETFILYREFTSELHSFPIREEGFRNLLLMCLNREIRLSLCYLDFTGITILCYEITGISGEMIISYSSF